MKSHLCTLFVALLAMVGLLGTAPELWAIPLDEAKIIIEVNGTDGDGGIQISVDGDEWIRLTVFDPSGLRIFDVSASNSLGVAGVTELFIESEEPSFEDLPLDQLLARFPKGNYRIEAITVEGVRLTGQATLKHNIPAGPLIVSPSEGATLHRNAVVIDWAPVTAPLPGSNLPVKIVGYQVTVEGEREVFSANLPATITQVKVPAEVLQANTEYDFEVLAIEQSGNQTITESSFNTAP